MLTTCDGCEKRVSLFATNKEAVITLCDDCSSGMDLSLVQTGYVVAEDDDIPF